MSAMRLSDLLRRDVAIDPEITGVTADSRKVRPGWLFAIVSGARDRAIVSFRLKHIDVERGLIDQDPREVRTKKATTGMTMIRAAAMISPQSELYWPERR